jgi:hypothetical protein
VNQCRADLKPKNTQPSYIFNRENPQNSEPQNRPRLCRKAMHCQAGCGPVSWCLIMARPDRAWQTGPCCHISGTARITILEA